jgi:hypothetical protein
MEMEYTYSSDKIWKTADELWADNAKASLAYAFMFSSEKNPRWQDEYPLYNIGTVTEIIDEKYMWVMCRNDVQRRCRTDYMACDTDAFAVDDQVAVKFEDCDKNKPVVVGFWNDPKSCCFKEKWYQSLTEYYNWVEIYMWFEDLPVVPFEIITVEEEDYKNSYLKMRHTGSQTGLTRSSTSKMKLVWVTTDVPETDSCNKLRLKFNFSGTYPINQSYWSTVTSLTISGPTGGPATIIFGANPQFFIESPELADNLLDDMEGAEQEIDLKDYGATFEGPPRYISLDSNCRAGEFPPIDRATQSLDLYYLEFF